MFLFGIALASQIFEKEVSLEEALQLAPLHLEATVLEGAKLTHFTVRVGKVAHDHRSEAIKKVHPLGDTLQIYRHATPLLHTIARYERNTGTRRSPIVKRLHDGAKPTPGKTYCMLLHTFYERSMQPSAGFSLALVDGVIEGSCPKPAAP